VPVTIEELPADRLDALEPLWLALLEHHGKVSIPALTMVGPTDSWGRRRGLYAKWLAVPGAFALTASADGLLVGYALVSIEDTVVLDDHWEVAGPAVAELQTLVVAPEGRGRGVGTALMDAVEARLRAAGITDLVVGVVAGNSDAQRFYERRGMTTFYKELYRRL
jgi:ribosomal protein S18 acetylase RimI-like enzyme